MNKESFKRNKKYKSASVGFSLGRTTCDNGCGVHADKRLKRKNTRAAKRREWESEQLS